MVRSAETLAGIYYSKALRKRQSHPSLIVHWLVCFTTGFAGHRLGFSVVELSLSFVACCPLARHSCCSLGVLATVITTLYVKHKRWVHLLSLLDVGGTPKAPPLPR